MTLREYIAICMEMKTKKKMMRRALRKIWKEQTIERTWLTQSSSKEDAGSVAVMDTRQRIAVMEAPDAMVEMEDSKVEEMEVDKEDVVVEDLKIVERMENDSKANVTSVASGVTRRPTVIAATVPTLPWMEKSPSWPTMR